MASEQQTLDALRKYIEAQDWKRASQCTDSLRIGNGWTYKRFSELFGADKWEEYAQEMDDADAEG